MSAVKSKAKAKAKKVTKKTDKTEFAIVGTMRTISENCRNTVRDYNEKYVKSFVDTGRELGKNLKTTRKDLKSGLKQMGRELAGSVKTDTRMVFDRAVETARTNMPEIPGLETAREKVGQGLEAVSDRINLPEKSDMDKLNQAMETLGGKLELLAVKYGG
jgi:hypothetical protein